MTDKEFKGKNWTVEDFSDCKVYVITSTKDAETRLFLLTDSEGFVYFLEEMGKGE